MLLHVLADNATRQFRSFAFELDNGMLDAETALFYKRPHNIHFGDLGVDQFAAELSQRVSRPVEPSDGALGDSISPDAPTVFLCHASEDGAFVATIAMHLRQNGINTWLDRNDLRGGSNWDTEIKRVLREEVHYVVVIQSAALMRKGVGYVNKELTQALERQQEYRGRLSFIIPVTIDPDRGSLLEDLDHLHTVDLSSGELDDLVKEINRQIEYAGKSQG